MKFKLLLCRKSNFLSPKMHFWRFKKFFYCLVVLFSSISLYSCKTEDGNSNKLLDNPIGSVFDFSYELEHVTFTKFGEGTATDLTDLTTVERVGGMGHVRRNKILLSVFNDGSTELTIQKLNPLHREFVFEDSSLANPTPQTAITKVSRDGSYHFYDAQNKEIIRESLNNNKMKKMDFSGILKVIRDNPEQITTNAYNELLLSNYSVEPFLKLIRDGSGEVKSLGNGVVSVQYTINPSNLNALNTLNVNKTNFRDAKDVNIESFVDTVGKILLVSNINSKDGKLSSKTYLRYKAPEDAKARPICDLIHTERKVPDTKSGKSVTKISDDYYDNFKFLLHK